MTNINGIYIDFDRTLFNTDALGLEVKNLRNKYNVTDNIWKKYEKEFKNNNNNCFNMFSILFNICHNENISYNILNELNEIIVNKSSSFIYDDALNFLKKLQGLKTKKYILTFGDKDFQGRKIYNSNIEKYFDEIIITPINKFEIPNKIDYKNGIFIDDNPKDVEGLYEQNPHNIIRIRRDNVKYSDIDLKYNDIKEYKNLDNLNYNNLIFTKRKVLSYK